MAYATTSDVQRHMPSVVGTLGASSTPTSTEVEAFLDATYGELNSALASKGYTVPVTTPNYWLEDLTALNAIGAAAYALAVAFPQEAGPGQVAEAPVLMGIWERRLALIRAGKGIPNDAPRSANLTAPRSYFVTAGAIGSDDAEDDFGDSVDANPRFRSAKDLA